PLFGDSGYVSSVNGMAVSIRTCSISSTLILLSTWRSNAATPATAGPAIDVPLIAPYPSPGNEERIPTPGAEISGLISSYGEGPSNEKSAKLSSLSVAPVANDSG